MKIYLRNELYDILSIKFFDRLVTKYKGGDYPNSRIPLEWVDEYVLDCQHPNKEDSYRKSFGSHKIVMTLSSINKEVICDEGEELDLR